MNMIFPSLLPLAADAPTKGDVFPVGNYYYIDIHRWMSFYSWSRALSAGATFVAILLAGLVLARIFRGFLLRNKLRRPFAWGFITLAFYFTLISLHTKLMVDSQDLFAVIIHKLFVAISLIVFVRFIDRLLIVPLLTRGGKVALSRFIHQIVVVILSFFVAAGYLHWAFDVDVSSVLAGSAVVSIVLGLALQETLGNFFSGMVLQASVPFQPGDWIQIGEIEGRVVEMTWRAVTLQTASNNHVLIPNSAVAKDKIINYHTPTPATAFGISVGVDYNVAPNEVRRVLVAAAAETPGVLADPAPSAAVASFDDSAITYRVGFWINDPQTHGGVEQAVRTSVWYRLKQAGYNIPYPTRTVELVDMEKHSQRQHETGAALRLSAIGAAPLFARLTDDQKQRLAREASDLTFAAGQTLYRQSTPGTSAFVLLEGVLDVFMTASDGKEYDVDDIVAVSLFGELSAMTDQNRGETIRAQTDVRVMEVTREHVRSLLAESPQLAAPMAEVVAQRHAEWQGKLQQITAAAHSPHVGQGDSASGVLDRMRRLFSGLHHK
jgi:small-conductance mechanosensitive channel/CRP-like cAMP-binding protein